MYTDSRIVINSMKVKEVPVETFKDYKKRVDHGSILANIDKVYWKLLPISLILGVAVPPLLAVCLLYLPVALIAKPFVDKEHKKLYEYERRIQTVAPNIAGVQPVKLRNKKGQQ